MTSESRRTGHPNQFLLRDTVINLMGLSVPLVVGLFAIPPTVRALGVDRFGLLAFGWVLLGYAGALDLGVGRASTRAAAQALAAGDLDLFARIASSAMLFAAALGTVAALLLGTTALLLVRYVLHFPSALADEAQALFIALAVGLPATLSLGAARGLLEAGRRFDLVQLVLIPANVLLYVLPAVGATAGLPLPVLGLLLVGSRVGALLAFLVLLRLAFPAVKYSRVVDVPILMRLIRYGGWLTVSSVVGLLVVYGERSVIAAILSVGALTYYVIAYELGGRLWVIPGALSSVLFPLFSSDRSFQSEDRSFIAARMVRYLLLIIAVPVLTLVVWGGDLVELWLGPTTGQGVRPIVGLFASGVLLNSLAYVPLVLLQASGRADLAAKLHALEVIPSLVVTGILTLEGGLIGAVGAWVGRVGTDAIALFAIASLLNRSLAASLLRYASRPAVAVVATGASLALLKQALEPAAAASLGFLALIAFVVVSWLFVLDSWDRHLVLGVLARRTRTDRGIAEHK